MKKPETQKKFKIGVVPIYGAKPTQLKGNANIEFVPFPLDFSRDFPYWPTIGFYNTIYGFGYRVDDKSNYKFKEYQEDLVFSYMVYELMKKDMSG